MVLTAAPIKQRNHKYINNAIDKWLDIHFGDTSFNGRVVIGHRKNGGGIYTMSARSLTELRPYVRMIHASARLDYYITANTVSGVSRRIDHLFGLQNIVIDVDCHDKKYARNVSSLVEAFIWRLKRDLWGEGVIPTPNSIVRTGRGLQLWWAIVPCYGGRDYDKSFYHYNKIKNTFMDHIDSLLDEYTEELEGLEIDRGASNNPVGYFRLPCTYNTTAKCYSSLEILHSERYDQRELTRIAPPGSEEDFEIRQAKSQNVPMKETDRDILRNFKGVGVRRVLQLIKLRNLRDNVVGAEMRDHFNFSMYNALRMTLEHSEAMVYLYSYNAGFKNPMSYRELENCVSTASKIGGYKYTNLKLIELLDITEYEQQVIGLFPSPKKYLAKPNASRDAARKALREDRDSKIVELVEKGTSQVEIARILGIGKNTVYRVLKRLREQAVAIMEAHIDDDSSRHHFGSLYVFLLRTIADNKYTKGRSTTTKAPENRGVSFAMPISDSS